MAAISSPEARDSSVSLRGQLLRLQRDWDSYKQSLSGRRRSSADTSAASPDLLHLLRRSPRQLVSSLQKSDARHSPGDGRRLLEAFERAVEEGEADSSSPSTVSCAAESCSSSSGSLGGDGDAMSGETRAEWMLRIGWLAIGALALVLALISIRVFAAEEAAECMVPT